MSSSNLSAELAIEIKDVSHRYKDLMAVNQLSLSIARQQIFGILGPNGSGKSTLFRLIATLSQLQEGSILVSGFCTRNQTELVRQQIGVVFQSPSLDRKLTVLENIRCQAALYGLAGRERDKRIDEFVRLIGLQDKLSTRCEKLSGGQKRRVELAKGLLHRPAVLLLDEPSTGLDPAARLDLWHALVQLKDTFGTTVVMTTHLLDEADKCDQVAILNAGKLVACDRPEALRAETGQTVISIETNSPQEIASMIEEKLMLKVSVFDQQLRIATSDANQLLPSILDLAQAKSTSVTIGRPSLEDVFIAKTGHKFHYT